MKKLNFLKAQLVHLYDKFWDLLPHTFEGEITKASFLMLYSKILKLLLPLFNHSEIDKFSTPKDLDEITFDFSKKRAFF